MGSSGTISGDSLGSATGEASISIIAIDSASFMDAGEVPVGDGDGEGDIMAADGAAFEFGPPANSSWIFEKGFVNRSVIRHT